MPVPNKVVENYCRDVVTYAVLGDEDGMRETLENAADEKVLDAVFGAIDEAHRVTTEFRESAAMISEIPEEQGMEPRELLYRAVQYALNRAQTDPDFGYQAGPGCEVFRRLCVAEAAHLGKTFEEVEKERSSQEGWRDRQPRVLELEEQVELLLQQQSEMRHER